MPHVSQRLADAMLAPAVAVGSRSPCQKSKRGVVIFAGDQILAEAHNHPPRGFACAGTDECRASCAKRCVHAEQAAIIALRAGPPAPKDRPLQMLHVKVVDGAPVPSGMPSCADCSKLIVEAGIETMWLVHHAGPMAYSAKTFHELSLDAQDIRPFREYEPPPPHEVMAIAGGWLLSLERNLRCHGQDASADELAEAIDKNLGSVPVSTPKEPEKS